MKFFAYFACVDSAGAKEVREHTIFREICGFFHVDSENIVIEIVDIKRPFSEQRLLKELINTKMNRGDTIVITDLSCLGRNVEDIEEALFLFFRKEINVYCYHPRTRIEPAIECCMSFLITVQKKVDIHNLKSTRSRYRTMKKALGRKKGSKHKMEILKLKLKGHTQIQTAKILGISISTVKRHWKNTFIT
jgi:DNA invertase Pin-like site-specific DNA recombinase